MTSVPACGILRQFVLPPLSHRLCGRPNNSLAQAPTPAKRAGPFQRPETSPGVRRSTYELRSPGFLFACLLAWRRGAPVPSQLNRDDAHVFRLERVRWGGGSREPSKPHNEEFDPGSGRTLAACLMHASRTHGACSVSGARLSITWERTLRWGITPRKRR